MRNSVITILIVGLLVPVFAARAQQAGVPSKDSIQFFVSPSVAQPNFPTKATVESFLVNLDLLQISWFLDGELVESGPGKREIYFTTGPVGSSISVSVVIGSGTEAVEFEKTISPQGVSIVWEADSYTPPFYKGRSLFPPGGNAKLVAVPGLVDSNGLNPNPENLVYTWKRDGTVLGNDSGIGKRSIYVEGSVIETSPLVEVVVSTADKSLEARNAIRIPVSQPEILFYRYDPLMGTLFNLALGNNIDMDTEEVVVDVYPMFFSGDRIAPRYTWRTNGNPITNADPFITLRKPGTSGVATLSVKAQHEEKILQAAEKFLKINFE